MTSKVLQVILILVTPVVIATCKKSKIETTGNIGGRVYDKITSQPIPTAEVKISATGQTEFTGTDGTYKFTRLESKEYQITVSKVSYVQETKSIAVTANGTANLDFALSPFSLTITPTTQDVTDAAGTTQFTITSNISWTASIDQPWCSIDHASGSGNNIITVTFQRNTTSTERMATLTVTGSSLASETAMVAQQVAFPTNGLLAYYPFNENANDESGNGNNGTVIGASLTGDRHGNANRAYHFNGINNYVNIPHTSALMLTGVDFTISVWATHSGIDDLDKALLIKSDGSNINSKWVFWYKPFNAPRGLGFLAASKTNEQSFGGYVNDFVLNNWYHYCVTKTATELKFYINGGLVLTDSHSVIISPTSSDVRIGGAEVNEAADQWWLGKLDDIGIWNRALTSSEVAALYYH